MPTARKIPNSRAIIVRLPVELHKRLARKAEQDDRPVASLARVAIKKFLEEASA